MKEQARRRFKIYAGGAAYLAFALVLVPAVGYWQLALVIAGVLAWESSWLREFYVLGWPDSRPGFPLRYLGGISRGQHALGDLAGTTLIAVGIMTLWPNIFGFAAGAIILATSTLSVGLWLIAGRSRPG